MSAPEDPVSDGHDGPEDALERAQARLDEACARVAARLDELASANRPGPDGADEDAIQAALSDSRAREAALAEAAEAASDALSQAMADLSALRGGGR